MGNQLLLKTIEKLLLYVYNDSGRFDQTESRWELPSLV
jgi:hypothetical protein